MIRARPDLKPDSWLLARAWPVYLVLGVLATFGYFLLPEIPQDVFYILVGLSAVAAILVGARRQPAGRRLPFYLFAGGLLIYVVGDVIYTVYEDALLVEDPFPSVADVFYLAFYPVFVAALVLLIRRRAQGRDWGASSTQRL